MTAMNEVLDRLTAFAGTHQPVFLAGQVCEGAGSLEVRNPYNDETIGTVGLADRGQLDTALEAASEGFRHWRSLPAHRKHELLSTVAGIVEQRREELAKLITIESGKPIRDSRTEVNRCVFTFGYAAEEARRIASDVVPMDLAAKGTGRLGIVRRFPIGTVLGITPFNTPLNLVTHKVAPALAAGNPVLVKPALETPLIALRLGEIAAQAGVPPEMLSILPASNEVAQDAVLDPRVAMVSFTGGTKTGWRLRDLVPRKRMTLELGGNCGVVVHKDADLDLAVEGCAVGSFNYSGQSCTSVQRILIHKRIFDEFTERLVDRVGQFCLGNPMDEDTDIGPMITRQAAERTESRIRAAVGDGAKLLAGGERDGAVVAPAIFTNVTDDMEVICEEVFAPIVSLQPYEDFDTALERLDDERYGLQAGVFTRDIERIFQAHHRVRVGGLMVNEVAAFRVDHMPYGGVKESGQGKEGLRYAIEEMTESRFMMLTYDLLGRAAAQKQLG